MEYDIYIETMPGYLSMFTYYIKHSDIYLFRNLRIDE